MRQVGRDRKISDSHRKGYSCPMCENTMCSSQINVTGVRMGIFVGFVLQEITAFKSENDCMKNKS